MTSRQKHPPIPQFDLKPLPRLPNELPVFLQKLTFQDSELLLGKFNNLDSLPQNGEPLEELKDEDNDRMYCNVKVARYTYAAHLSDASDKKFMVLLEKKGNKVFLSKISKELFFFRKTQTLENQDELNLKTLMLMKHKRIKSSKNKSEEEGSEDSLNEIVKNEEKDEMDDLEVKFKFEEINNRNKEPEIYEDSAEEAESFKNTVQKRGNVGRGDDSESESSFSDSSEN